MDKSVNDKFVSLVDNSYGMSSFFLWTNSKKYFKMLFDNLIQQCGDLTNTMLVTAQAFLLEIPSE